jgi:hypothetical protein
MRRLTRTLTFLLLLPLIFTRCASHNHDDGSLANDYTIVPMTQYKFEPSDIKTGSVVRIFAFTGGKESEGKKLYYSQFLVRDPATDDTIRILAAMISVDSVSGSDAQTYTPAYQFEGAAGIFDAIFEESPKQNEMLDLLSNLPSDSVDLKHINAAISDTAGRKDYVLINKNADIFTRRYKTAIGVLRFHNKPW